MKQLASSYSLSGASVTLTGVNVPLSQILLVSNATTGSVLYSMAGPSAAGYTQGANSVITLASAPGVSDKLTIYYDDGVAATNAPTNVSVSNFPSTQLVSATALPLPTGAATAALQTSGNTSLANIDADLGSVADAAASSDTGSFSLISLIKRLLGKFTALTDGSQKSQIINGANTLAVDSSGALVANVAPIGSVATYTGTSPSVGTILIGPTDVSAFREVAIHIVSIGVAGQLSIDLSNNGTDWYQGAPLQNIISSSPTFTGSINGTGAFKAHTYGMKFFRVRVSGTPFGATSLSVTYNQTCTPNLFTATTGTITANTGLSQPLTDTQLRASAVPVSGTVTANVTFPTTQPVSASSLPLPTGAAVESGGNLAAINTKTPALGSATMAGSVPVTLATDGPGVANLGTIATNTGRIPAQGAAVVANSTPVNIASNQVVPISATALPLPTGAATSANQTTANTSLANLDADLGNVADAVASSDTGSFSLIALTKRLLGKFTALTDGTQKSQIINGANTLAVNADGSSQVNQGSLTQSYNFTGAIAANTVVLGSTDCSNYRQVALQATSLGSGGSFTAQISNDGTNWMSAATQRVDSTGFGISYGSFTGFSTGVAQVVYLYGFRYFRLIVNSAFTAGTTSIAATYSQVTPLQGLLNVVAPNGIIMQPAPSSIYGFSIFHTLISAASTNATSVKNSSGTIGTCLLTNNSASVKYVKFFNLATAPTMGTSTPTLNLPIQANSTLDASTAFAGLRLTAGIAYAITGGSALLDTTAVAAGDVIVNLSYV